MRNAWRRQSSTPKAYGHRQMTFRTAPSADPTVAREWWLCTHCHSSLLGQADGTSEPPTGSGTQTPTDPRRQTGLVHPDSEYVRYFELGEQIERIDRASIG